MTSNKEIMKEIHEPNFLVVIDDKTSDIANTLQLIIIFRYLSNRKPVERLCKFLNPIHNDEQTLASCLMQEINDQVKSTSTTLLAQTCDSSAFMNVSFQGAQATVKNKYLNAAYIHCMHTTELKID